MRSPRVVLAAALLVMVSCADDSGSNDAATSTAGTEAPGTAPATEAASSEPPTTAAGTGAATSAEPASSTATSAVAAATPQLDAVSVKLTSIGEFTEPVVVVPRPGDDSGLYV